jgi:hypothetical protein
MRMSIPHGIAACAIFAAVSLMSAVPLSTPAFAAKQSTVLGACKRTPGCWSDRAGTLVFGCSPHACFECYNGNCHRTAVTAAGGAKVQRGPNAVITTPTTSRGSTAIQTGPTAVITTPTRSRGSTAVQTGATAVVTATPVRPTGPGGSPCTGHCGPQGGRKR